MDDFFTELEKAMAVAVPPPEPEVQSVAQNMHGEYEYLSGCLNIPIVTLDSIVVSDPDYATTYAEMEAKLIAQLGVSSGMVESIAQQLESAPLKAAEFGLHYGMSKGKIIDLVGKPHIKLAKKGNTKKHPFSSEDWKGKKPK